MAKQTKKSPLQIVTDKYGSKDELVKLLTGKLERRKAEGKDEFAARLKKISSKKLMKLLDAAEEVEKLGGRKVLIDAIHDFHRAGSQKEDKDFKAGLEKRRTTGSLLDEYKSVQKRRQMAKKA